MLRDPTFMQAFLDIVIPPTADGRMPGAGTIGREAGLADSLEADTRLAAIVEAGLEAVREAAIARDPGGLPALPPPARLEVIRFGCADSTSWTDRKSVV